MTKLEAYQKFVADYAPISMVDSKSARFAKVADKLLDETFLIQAKDGDLEDFQAALVFLDALRDYFALADIELCMDEEYRIIYIRPLADRNRYHLFKLDTIVLLVLRSLAFSAKQEVSLTGQMVVTVKDIQDKVRLSKIYGDSLNITDFGDALRTLRHYKIIDFVDDISKSDTKITIFNSIFIVVNANSLDELNDRLSKYLGGSDDEKFNEDQAD